MKKVGFKKAMFIAIEGLEGAGKTTIMDAIIVFLKNNGICCLKTNEPNSEDDFCSGIRWLLKKKSTTEITKEAECLLFYAARAQSVLSIVKPSLDRGEWVVSDRHDWSTIAYQAYGSGVDISSLDLLREFAIGGIKPDFTIYIDIDPRIGMERAVRRGELDRIEERDILFFDNARKGFKALVKNNPDTSVLIDGAGDRETVAESAINAISAHFMMS